MADSVTHLPEYRIFVLTTRLPSGKQGLLLNLVYPIKSLILPICKIFTHSAMCLSVTGGSNIINGNNFRL